MTSLIDTTVLDAFLESLADEVKGNTDSIQTLAQGGLQDVTQYGVRGDGRADDTAAIQKLFDAQFEDTQANKRTRILYFPGGRYKVTKTLVVRSQFGFRVLGGGITPSIKRFWGNNSDLVWAGKAGEPVVKTYAFGLVWDGLNIDGSGKAGVGMLIDKEKVPGKLPTGKYYVPTISVRNCQTGIQVGSDLGTHNCDWLCWGFLNVDKCEIGYLLANQMGITNNIELYRTYRVGTMVHVNGGGNMNVQNTGVMHETDKILHFGKPGGSSNTGSFRFNNVKQDTHVDECIWFDQETNDAGSVLFENSHLANDNLKTPLFRLTGYVDLTLRRVWGLPKGAIDAKSVTAAGREWSPNILVERCKCASSVKNPSDLFGSLAGTCYTKTRDLHLLDGTPIE